MCGSGCGSRESRRWAPPLSHASRRRGRATEGPGPSQSPKELDEAGVAVRLLVLLLEGALVELLEAEGADKMLRVELPCHGCDAAAGDGLLAARTERAALLVVMDFTERAPGVLEEAAVHERGVAFPADKTFWVPQGVESRDVVLQDGLAAPLTAGGKELVKVLAAILLPVFLVKAFLSKGPPTLDATEVFRVPILIQRSHHFIQDGFAAESAAGREELEVISLAVRGAVLLKKIAAPHLLLAVGADKVLGVPGTPQRGHHLPSDGFLAGSTQSLGCGRNALAAEIRFQHHKHAVQIPTWLAWGRLGGHSSGTWADR